MDKTTLLEQLNIPEPLAAPVKEFTAARDRVMADADLTAEAKSKRVDGLREHFDRRMRDAEAGLLAERQRVHDRAAGDIQAALKPKPIPERESERQALLIQSLDRQRQASLAAMDAQLIATAEDAGAIEDVLETAFRANDAEILPRLGPLAIRRLERLALEEAKSRNGVPGEGPTRVAWTRTQERLAAWQAEHPTLEQQLAVVAEQRLIDADEVARHVRHARQVAGTVRHLGSDFGLE